MVRPSSCIVKGGILSFQRYLATYLRTQEIGSIRPSLGAGIRGGKPRSTHLGSGDTPLGESSPSMHSCSFKCVRSLDTKSGSHCGGGADADTAHSS